MFKKTQARSYVTKFVALIFVMLMIMASVINASALEGVTAVDKDDTTKHAANEWIPVSVDLINKSEYNLKIHEVGFRNIPEGLEVDGELKTLYTEGKVINALTTDAAVLHSVKVRKTSTVPDNPDPDPITPKTGDSSSLLPYILLILAGTAALLFVLYKFSRKTFIFILTFIFAAISFLNTGVLKASALEDYETAECTITLRIEEDTFIKLFSGGNPLALAGGRSRFLLS